MLNRLVMNWVYGGFLAGILLVCLVPVIAGGWPPALCIVFLCLPAYMLHQYEEHDDDRFRRFFNETIGKGHEVLSPLATFVVNVPGVWGVMTVSFWLAAKVESGFGLIAVYLVLVNAGVHVIHTALFRKYNPGLGTATILFLPLGSVGLYEIQIAAGGTAAMHALGLGVAVVIHAALMVYIRCRSSVKTDFGLPVSAGGGL